MPARPPAAPPVSTAPGSAITWPPPAPAATPPPRRPRARQRRRATRRPAARCARAATDTAISTCLGGPDRHLLERAAQRGGGRAGRRCIRNRRRFRRRAGPGCGSRRVHLPAESHAVLRRRVRQQADDHVHRPADRLRLRGRCRPRVRPYRAATGAPAADRGDHPSDAQTRSSSSRPTACPGSGRTLRRPRSASTRRSSAASWSELITLISTEHEIATHGTPGQRAPAIDRGLQRRPPAGLLARDVPLISERRSPQSAVAAG